MSYTKQDIIIIIMSSCCYIETKYCNGSEENRVIIPTCDMLEFYVYRYDVTCPEGMILAYSFTTHVLENRTDTCETTDKCVDYVQLTFPNSAEKVTSCGQEPDLNTLFADGYGALYAEFYANRHEQAAGFSMDVICYDPEFLPSRRRRQSAGSERCTRVSDAKRPTVDREAQLVSFSCGTLGRCMMQVSVLCGGCGCMDITFVCT